MNSAASATRPVQVAAENLRKTYQLGKETIEVLRGVTLEIREGETVSITGASGAGKSTLLHMLGGLDAPTSGTVRWRGSNLYTMNGRQRNTIRAEKVGLVFQFFHLLPELDLIENVLLPVWSRRGALKRAHLHRQRATELLDRVGLSHRLHHRPLELSGGEQQRAAIARALIHNPEIVFADEPTGNLDSKTGEQVLNYLFELTALEKHTLVLVTHNEAVAMRCERQMVIRDGALG